MSAPALAQAVRDVIQGAVLLNGQPIDANTCEVTFDGAPKPGAGQMFIGVHLGAWNPMPFDYSLDESFQISVTITLRLGVAPQDRFGVAVWAAAVGGLDAVCRQIATLIHQNQTCRAYANDGKSYSINTTTTAGFYTTTQFVPPASPPKFRDYKWFTGGELTDDPLVAAQSGVSATLTFKAERSQAIPQMT